MPGTKCVAAPPVTPLSMEVGFYLLGVDGEHFLQVLDSLSVHSKMSLIHSIVTHILKQVHFDEINKTSWPDNIKFSHVYYVL